MLSVVIVMCADRKIKRQKVLKNRKTSLNHMSCCNSSWVRRMFLWTTVVRIAWFI